MLHKEIFGLALLGFLLWVVFTTDPNTRITRICSPVAWTGNASTSVAALVSPNSQGSVNGWFNKLDYGCRYSVWRMFYQSEYAAWEAANANAKLDAEQVGATGEPDSKSVVANPKKPPAAPASPRATPLTSPKPEVSGEGL